MRVIVGVTLGVLAFGTTAAGESLTLEAAKRAGVRMEVESTDSYRGVAITFRNDGRAAVAVRIEPGTVFENRNAQEQDLTLSTAIEVSLRPGETVTRRVGTYCIRAHDGPPSAGARFWANGFDPAVAAILRGRHGKRPDPRVQSVVWSQLSAGPTPVR